MNSNSNRNRRDFNKTLGTVLVTGLGLPSGKVLAQESKPIRIVVPFTPGGSLSLIHI